MGRCTATWKRKCKLLWREDGPPNHFENKVDSDQKIINKEVSLCAVGGAEDKANRAGAVSNTAVERFWRE